MLLNKIRVFNWVTDSEAPRGWEEGSSEPWVGGARAGDCGKVGFKCPGWGAASVSVRFFLPLKEARNPDFCKVLADNRVGFLFVCLLKKQHRMTCLCPPCMDEDDKAKEPRGVTGTTPVPAGAWPGRRPPLHAVSWGKQEGWERTQQIPPHPGGDSSEGRPWDSDTCPS